MLPAEITEILERITAEVEALPASEREAAWDRVKCFILERAEDAVG